MVEFMAGDTMRISAEEARHLLVGGGGSWALCVTIGRCEKAREREREREKERERATHTQKDAQPDRQGGESLSAELL